VIISAHSDPAAHKRHAFRSTRSQSVAIVSYDVFAEVQDDFQRKENTTYQNMRHLVNDVKYVQQHIQKLFELLRHISSDVCDSFPLGDSQPGDGRTTYISGESTYIQGSGGGAYSDQQYSDHVSSGHEQRTAFSGESRLEEHGNHVRTDSLSAVAKYQSTCSFELICRLL
jgi:hypothetical protein